MTTINRETLELAALAAGMSVRIIGEEASFTVVTADTVAEWCPDTDIADAARLAVRLDIEIQPLHLRVVAGSSDGDWDMQRHDGTEPDKLRAYCEAVTLCAAEIGRRMREGGR